MQSNSHNLRVLVYAALAIVLCIAFILIASCLVSREMETPLLGFASTIISVATLASIAFAVLVYMESVVLSKRVDDAKRIAKSQHEQTLMELSKIRSLHFKLAKSSLSGFLAAFMSMEPGSTYEKAVGELRTTVIDINLAHGTYECLLRAIQTAYKHNKSRFLRMEAEILEKSEQMEKAKKQRVRKYYLALNERVLASVHM